MPENFFNPLASQKREIYSDCILLIFNSYKSERSYGVDKENIVSTLAAYFDERQDEIAFGEGEAQEKTSREKSLEVINYLKSCGWLELEEKKNFQYDVVLTENAIPFIRTMNEVIKNEETEYQGLISKIHATLQNEELYAKPYEYILKNVADDTERLVSSLKKLNVSIKRHIDKLTEKLELSELLERFVNYQDEILSKPLKRLKTSENVSRFRSSIVKNLDEMLFDESILERLAKGRMEIESQNDFESAKRAVVQTINDVKSSFFNLDKIISDIDRKHRFYVANAVLRAKFILSADTNQEGKINRILRCAAEQFDEDETETLNLDECFKMSPQRFVSEESFRSVRIIKGITQIEKINAENVVPKERRNALKQKEIESRRKRIFSKKIDEYVLSLLKEKMQMNAKELPLASRKDFLNLIYIRIYGQTSKIFGVEKLGIRIKTGGFEFSDFRIFRRLSGQAR